MDKMVIGIIQTATETYTATIDGTEWSNITPVSRFYVMVQDAIAEGVEVTQED
jgi:hypothetical protein